MRDDVCYIYIYIPYQLNSVNSFRILTMRPFLPPNVVTLNNEVIINTEVRSIPVTKKGVYFAFRDQGACISLLAIKVYYITCPEVTASFAYFPGTPTGRELTSIEQAEGKFTLIVVSSLRNMSSKPCNFILNQIPLNFHKIPIRVSIFRKMRGQFRGSESPEALMQRRWEMVLAFWWMSVQAGLRSRSSPTNLQW